MCSFPLRPHCLSVRAGQFILSYMHSSAFKMIFNIFLALLVSSVGGLVE